MEKNVATEKNSAPVDLDLEDILDDLELSSGEDESVVELIGDEEVDDDEIRDLEVTLSREEAYGDQESTIDADPEAVVAAKNDDTKAAAGKTRAAGKKVSTGAAKTPRAPRVELEGLPADVFVLEGDVSAMSDEDKAAAKAATIALKPGQVKIAEKFDNLFQALSTGKQPSVYVTQVFKFLDDKKTVSSGDITTMLKGSYTQGTAMSQCGQVMNLFAALKVAHRAKNTLTLNEDSVIAQRIRDVIAAAKAA